MEIILLRHGKAEDHGHPLGDAARALVEKGRAQSRAAARLLKSAKLLPEIVLTSPLVRARQTADEFCTEAGMPGPVIEHWLACGAAPETILSELRAFSDFKRVAIIGHEPDFSIFVQWTLGSHGGAIEFKKGAIACVRLIPPSRQGTLLYLSPPRLTGS